MIYYNEKFYEDFEEILEELKDYEDKKLDSPEEYIIHYQECRLEKLFKFDIDEIVINATYDRASENGDELDKAIELIRNNCNEEAINGGMPELWYPIGREIRFDLSVLEEN